LKHKQECPTDLRSARDSVLNRSESSESKFLGHLLFSLRLGEVCTVDIQQFLELSFRVVVDRASFQIPFQGRPMNFDMFDTHRLCTGNYRSLS